MPTQQATESPESLEQTHGDVLEEQSYSFALPLRRQDSPDTNLAAIHRRGSPHSETTVVVVLGVEKVLEFGVEEYREPKR